MTANDFTRHLIVVDMQNDFLTGALANGDAVAILPDVIDKVERAREKGVQVSWTLDTHGEDYMDTQEGAKLPVPHCIKGTWGHDLADGLCPQEGEVQYWKNTFGSFFMATDIKTALEQRWLNGHIMNEDYPTPKGENVEIELVGVCTDICVVSNAMLLKAALPEARIVVDASCCAGVTPENHETALAAMRACQIEVVNDDYYVTGTEITD